MNSKSASIYELSKRAEEEEMEREARSIANAYRKVQQLPARPREIKKEEKKETGVKSNGQSAYAAKVKQALKEINASKAKQMEDLAKCLPQRQDPPPPNNPATKLQKAALIKILNVLQQQERRVLALCMRQLREWWEAEEKREGGFFRKWRLLRWLKAWRKEAKISRAARLQQEQQQAAMQRQSLELAAEFRTFSLLKKTLRAWHVHAKREARRRTHQNMLVVQQISAQQVQKKGKTRAANESKVVQENSALQQKVRGFLDGLKQKVTHQDRLRTIKEKTEQSRPNEEPRQETLSNQPPQEAQMAVEEIQEGQVAVVGVQQDKKPMTGDQLQQRRKQLQAKHKSRKEALQRLRQEKEGRRKEEEAQRMEVERQLQAQQRRIRQEKYKQYIRNKNEEAAWQRREASLTIMADQFNVTRLQKYYGLLPWASVRARCRQKIAFLHQTILLIMFRLKGNQFMANLADIASKKVDKLMQSMDVRYGRALLRRGLKAIRQNCLAERVAKEQYKVMHEVNSLKIVFTAWKSVRGQLAGQNYEWQKPRMKRAEEYYRMQLKHKAFRSMVMNREERKRETCIEEQKKLIKGKIQMLLQKNEEIDYNQYL